MSTRPGMNKAQLADVSTFVCEEYCHVLNQFFFFFFPYVDIQIYLSTVS